MKMQTYHTCHPPFLWWISFITNHSLAGVIIIKELWVYNSTGIHNDIHFQELDVRPMLTNVPIHHVSMAESVQMESIHTRAHVNLDMKVK